MKNPENIVRIFKAFTDENRLRIMCELHSGDKCACKLQESLNLGQSGLSYHMKILLQAGVVEARNEGKWTHYSLNEEGFYEAKRQLEKLVNCALSGNSEDCEE